MIWRLPLELRWLALAQSDPFHSMTGHFRGQRSRPMSYDLLWVIAILTTVVVGIWLLSRILARQERDRRYNSRPALFRALCRVHALKRPTRQLLKDLARAQGLADPARLFVEPQRFHEVNLPPALRSQKQQLTALQDRLFAGFPTERAKHPSQHDWPA